MDEVFTYRLAGLDDLEDIRALLAKSDLPVEDLGGKIQFLVCRDNNSFLAGCIGIEQYGKNGLLRSLAVDEKYRNKGLGNGLLESLLRFSQNAGVQTLHLLTTTADRYFLKKGFSVANKEQAPESIQSTTEFSSLCPASSVYMVVKISE